ncbi:hypothetical protein GIY23_11220 [Allosaccharopolyspora coralli]|uniref:Uncharacterized protein n=1 Tax=Allosaccharopolyspora coralli TaxID=2665642 RepID=A0A5Q3QES5_9PSEU|nr:hypothetical protein [Allosaccharopolyspora coralli]QGK70015.1 hypothetical protein GIY23_11220 [Allosaccharopolyspora coralli]
MSPGRPGQLRQWWWRTAGVVRILPALATIALAAGAVTHTVVDVPTDSPSPASGAAGPTGTHTTHDGTPCRWHGTLTPDTTGALLTCTYQHGILRWTLS